MHELHEPPEPNGDPHSIETGGLERDPRARFLFMSGYFDDNKYADQLTAGNLLLKPFKPAELLQRVAQRLANDGTESSA